MSWASHNTEAWNDICRKGIAAKIEQVLIEWEGLDRKDIDFELLEALVYSIEQDSPKVYDALMTWANDEICGCHADYFSGQIDDAMERAQA